MTEAKLWFSPMKEAARIALAASEQVSTTPERTEVRGNALGMEAVAVDRLERLCTPRAVSRLCEEMEEASREILAPLAAMLSPDGEVVTGTDESIIEATYSLAKAARAFLTRLKEKGQNDG